MRLVDKDQLLKELIEGQEAGLGLIESSKYGNINSIDDAIETVKYADEVDLSEIRTQIINEIKQKLEEYETTRYMDNIHMVCPYQAIFIDKKDFDKLFDNVRNANETDLSEHDNKIRANEQEKILDEAYAMLADELLWVLHTFGDDVYLSVADSISSTFRQLLKEQNPNYEKEQNLSQPLPAIDEEEIPFGNTNESNIEVQANLKTCDNEHDYEEEEDEDGFDPGDDD